MPIHHTDSTISPPAFHNARYAGWPHPPVQLPYVTSPLSTARHVYVANNIPSHRPQVNAAHTRELHYLLRFLAQLLLEHSSYTVHPQYETRPHTNFGVQGNHPSLSHTLHQVAFNLKLLG
jgi:hypothetical protein